MADFATLDGFQINENLKGVNTTSIFVPPRNASLAPKKNLIIITEIFTHFV